MQHKNRTVNDLDVITFIYRKLFLDILFTANSDSILLAVISIY